MVNTATFPMEIPDCYYPQEPTLVRPKSPTKKHTLHLSNLDDQKFLRFSIKYLYLYRKPPADVVALKVALSRALVDYYPLAGRVREVGDSLEVECNAEGAVFAEAFMDMSAEDFLEVAERPNRSWRKLLWRVESQSFVGVPPLVVQVTHLSCGGMILCTSINHCICDGVGSSQFLHAWSHYAAKPSSPSSLITPHHSRHALSPRTPLDSSCPPTVYTPSTTPHLDLTKLLLSQPLSPVSVTFSPADILLLKRRCVPSLKCTSFEALAAHVWRNWVRSLDPPVTLRVRLLFSVNARKRVEPELPGGYYGNGFVLGCAETTVDNLVDGNIGVGVRLVKEAKEGVDDGYVKRVVDHLEETKTARPDLGASLVVSQWARLGLEEVAFGGDGPVFMGSLGSEIYCLFLPVVGDRDAVRVLVSVPDRVRERFEAGLRDLEGKLEAGAGGAV